MTLVAIHILSIVYFTQRVASSLLHSKYTLPISQDVKLRMAARSQLGWIFGGLALLSLGVAAYAGVNYASLSFESWADERGIGSTPRFVSLSLYNHCLISGPDMLVTVPSRKSLPMHPPARSLPQTKHVTLSSTVFAGWRIHPSIRMRLRSSPRKHAVSGGASKSTLPCRLGLYSWPWRAIGAVSPICFRSWLSPTWSICRLPKMRSLWL